MTNPVKTILHEVLSITPFDDLEQEHVNDAVAWIDQTNNIFRISKPDIPPKHLVSYFVIYDKQSKQFLLIDHLKANAWLPSGGHVEPNEEPRAAVKREAYEELQLASSFDVVGNKPLFITVTETKPPHAHTDVSLWYVISGDSDTEYYYDKHEMNGYKWFSAEEILAMDTALLDPHMKRFIRKFVQYL